MITFKQLLLGLLGFSACAALISAADEQANESSVDTGRVTGVWRGEFSYPPAEEERPPVKFRMVMIQDGNVVVGLIKEPNTFGKRKDEPWLHAGFKGRFDRQTGKLTFTKTYDGTAGVDHSVEYKGSIARDGITIEGTWIIRHEDKPDYSGRFTLRKLPHEE